MSLEIQVHTSGDAMPLVTEALRAYEDPTALNQNIAESAAELTKGHLMGLNRHATARRLGASPTSYWEKKAESIEHSGTREGAFLYVATGDGMEALARVMGEVTIEPRPGRKYLTIPAIAAAYGKRAGSFPALRFVKYYGGDTLALAKVNMETVPGKKPGTTRQKWVTTPFYWLRTKVTLSQDRSLLPTDDEYADAIEAGAETFWMKKNL